MNLWDRSWKNLCIFPHTLLAFFLFFFKAQTLLDIAVVSLTNFCVMSDDRLLNQFGVFECKQSKSNDVLDPKGSCCYTTANLQ